MKSSKVTFYGLFGQQNLGNECTLQAMIHHTRRHLPEAELNCVCTDPGDTRARHGIPAYPIRPTPRGSRSSDGLRGVGVLRKLLRGISREALHWITAFRVLEGTNLFLAPGTGLLTDWGTQPLGRPYDLFKWCLLARLRGCTVQFVSTGAGPMFHSQSRWLIRAALWLAHSRSYRDSFSRDAVRKLGLNTSRDRVYPDLAFSLPPTMFAAQEHDAPNRLVVGVGLMDYHGERGFSNGNTDLYGEYLRKTSEFVAWLVEREYAVRILIGDLKYDSRPREDLRLMLESRGIRYDGRIQDDEPQSVEELLTQLASADMIVSPRFHNLLLALMLGKPVISVSYQEKNTELMKSVGLGEYCQPIETLDIETLKGQFLRLKGDAGTLTPAVERKAWVFRDSLDQQYREIFQGAIH